MELWNIAFLCLTCLTVVRCQEPTVTMDITQNYAKVGDNVTIECRVTNRGQDDLIFFAKFVGPTFDKNQAVQVAASNFLYTPYSEMKSRFSLRLAGMQGDTEYLYFHIFNSQVQDSARYGCLITDTEARDSIIFEVYRNAEVLGWSVNGTEVEEDGIADLEAGVAVPLSCTASKVMPQPEMHVLAGDNDITHKFKASHDIVPQCVKEQSTECLLHFYYNKTLHENEFEPSWDQNGKSLTCKSIIKVARLEPVSSSIILNVTFVPVFNCSTMYSAKLRDSKNVKCQLYSNPGLTEDITLSAFGTLYLKPGHEDDGVKFDFFPAATARDPSTVQITWSRVESRHFDVYSLQANNDIGAKQFQFNLREADTEGGGETDSASVNSFSLLTLIFITILRSFCQ